MLIHWTLRGDSRQIYLNDGNDYIILLYKLKIFIRKEILRMNPEVRFKTDDYYYYNRAVGVIKHNDKFLIMNENNAAHYHLPGGHIEIGENSLAAVTREIKEELDYNIKNTTLFCIQENFYKKKEVIQHGVEYYYLIELEKGVETVDREVIENDRGVEKHLLVKWISIDELKITDLKPFTVKALIIDNKLDTLTHVVKRD